MTLKTCLERFRPYVSGFYKPRTWAFWRSVLTCFCIGCIAGHWMEFPYCAIMNQFGIVEADYALWTDPWYHPYWVYGFGAMGLILVIEPLKERIIKRRKTLWGAFLETWLIAILLSMLMELGFGLLINQPDAAGEYPYWDNSRLPLNIFGQAWLVNDIFIGLAGMVVIWLVFPLVNALYSHFNSRISNYIFVAVVLCFLMCCIVSYTQLGFFSLWFSSITQLLGM